MDSPAKPSVDPEMRTGPILPAMNRRTVEAYRVVARHLPVLPSVFEDVQDIIYSKDPGQAESNVET